MDFDRIWLSGVVRSDDAVTAIHVSKEVVDGAVRYSLRDVACGGCNQSKDVGGKTLRRILAKEHSSITELEDEIVDVQFKGKNEKIGPGGTVKGVLLLLGLLPGEQAKARRSKIANLLLQHCAADKALVAAIRADERFKRLLHEMGKPEAEEDYNYDDDEDEESTAADDDESATEKEEAAAEGSIVIQSNELVVYEPFQPHTTEKREAKLLALANAYYTPLVREAIHHIELRCEARDARLAEEAKAKGDRPYGCVYSAFSPPIRRLAKMGASLKTAIARAKSLSTSGVPEPFQLIAVIQCDFPFEVEKRVHQHFAAARTYGKKKEFFNLPHMEIAEFFARFSHSLLGADPDLYRPSKPSRRPNPNNKRKAEEDAHNNDAFKAMREMLGQQAAEQAALRAMVAQLLARTMAAKE